jgi:dTDP-4-amino-4,6-dideoxygalactose transaminase
MTGEEFRDLCIAPACTLREALAILNRTARGMLLVLDDAGRLQRTLTDGDLRRAALEHVAETAAIAQLPAKKPLVVGEQDPLAAAVALMDQHQVDHIPVLDTDGRPVDIVLRRELSQPIWLSPPHLGEEETAFVEDAFRSNWIAPLGPHVDGFERELAAEVGIGHAAALSSGTAAIHLGLLLLGVQPGDTVFCSSLTFVGSCNPILYCGARPVFIDCEPGSWNMSPAALERAFEWAKRESRLPRCIVIVNLYGQSADMDALLPLCERYGVAVLEDAAESLGASYRRRASGTFGRLAVFSFNGNKIITTSGGGMLVSDDAQLVAQARKLATQARDAAPYYEHSQLGFNYRMSNVLAGIGRGQLRKLKERVSARRANFERYQEALRDLEMLQWMPEPEGMHSTRWLTCFALAGSDGERQRDRILQSFQRHSIDARHVWKPMHLQPLFRDAPYFAHEDGDDVSARLFATGLCLPSGSSMTGQQQGLVIDHLRRCLQRTDAPV